MNVVPLKSTKKLNKDCLYKVAMLQNFNTRNTTYFTPTVRIYLTDKSIHTFPLSIFRPESGSSFPSITWVCPDYQQLLNEREEMKIDKNLKKGDYVIPIHDSLKTLIKGRKYKVNEVICTEHKSKYSTSTWTDIKIKLEGSERLYISSNFRKCTSQETREISLKSLFDENVDTETVGKFKRKFDYLSTEEKVSTLVKLVMESSVDRYRNQMSIIEWTIDKTGSKYGLKFEDFDPIMNLPLNRILDILEN